MTMKPPSPFADQVWTDAIIHARSEFPNESCGLVVAGSYEPVANVAPNPKNDFEVDHATFRAALQRGAVEGVIHSHPNGTASPSIADMKSQVSCAMPFGVVTLHPRTAEYVDHFDWGDHVLDHPCLGRVWRSGVTDCFAMARAYYWQTYGFKMRDIPRENDWHVKDTHALFREVRANYPQFDDVTPQDFRDDPRPGDMLFFAFGTPHPNHVAIYEDNNLILHHMSMGTAGDLSSRRPLNTLGAKIVHVLRPKEAPK